jgi:hypothetical protein
MTDDAQLLQEYYRVLHGRPDETVSAGTGTAQPALFRAGTRHIIARTAWGISDLPGDPAGQADRQHADRGEAGDGEASREVMLRAEGIT